MNKINVWRIITDHFGTLKDYRTDRRSASDVFVFFVAPLLVGAGLAWAGFGFTASVLNSLLTAFSIFAGLLLNLLLLVHAFGRDGAKWAAGEIPSIRRRFVQEIHANVSFSILLAIAFILVALFALSITRPQGSGHETAASPAATFLLIYLASNFVLTLLMVLKRMHVLLAGELDRPTLRKSA